MSTEIMDEQCEIERLREDNAKLHRAIEEMTRSYVARCNENAKLREVVAAVIELRKWGVQFDDDRLRYITVQVDRADVERLDAALEAKP